MDGWMDGWMDGEVLITGMMVGWSVGVPKCLTSVSSRALGLGLRSLFFQTRFREGFRSDFFDFRRFLDTKMEAKIDFWEAFFRCFFRVRFSINFGSFFGGSKPEK